MRIKLKAGTGDAARKRGGIRSPLLTGGLVVLAIIVVALLVVVGASLIGGRVASSQLADAADLIEQADESVVEIDRVVGAQITSDLAAPADEALDVIEPAREKLEQALSIIRAAGPDLLEKDQQRAQLLTRAARGRVEMLDQAPVILKATSKSAMALPKAEAGWDKVILAETQTDKAVLEQRKLTKAGVTESVRLTKAASTYLTEARTEFVAAEDAFPEADFDAYIEYVDVLIERNRLSLEADAAWLDDDIAKANARTNAYNTAGDRVTSLRKALPVDTSSAVANAYEAVAGKAADEYNAGRSKATTADKQLR